MSKEMGLGKYFIISRQIENMNGRNIDKINEDIFEAFIGGLCLSNGLEVCMDLITNLLETQIDYSEKLYCDNNYKDQLLRYHHINKWKYPQYITIHFVISFCVCDFTTIQAANYLVKRKLSVNIILKQKKFL